MNLETWSITGESFHFGIHGLGLEETAVTYASDRLFSALLARQALRSNAAEFERWAQPLTRKPPPFVISSTFPFAGAVRFFPTPLRMYAPGGAPQPASGVRTKDLKKARYVSERLFRRILDGEYLAGVYPEAVALQGGLALVSKEEFASLPPEVRLDKQIWAQDQRPRVTIERTSSRSGLFFAGSVNYQAGCGLWFAVRWLDPASPWKAALPGLLADLGDAGLGAERSAGYGQAVFHPAGALELPDAGEGMWVNLSRYLPAEDEASALTDPRARYAITTVTGWIESPDQQGLRRKPLNLVQEGALLGPLSAPVPGRIADLRPSYPSNPDPLGHAVYRSGLALAVGLRGGVA